MSVSAASGFARLLAYNAGVGGSNPSPPTRKRLVNGYVARAAAMLCALRPRTGRESTGFRSLPQSLHAISDLVIPVGE